MFELRLHNLSQARLQAHKYTVLFKNTIANEQNVLQISPSKWMSVCFLIAMLHLEGPASYDTLMTIFKITLEGWSYDTVRMCEIKRRALRNEDWRAGKAQPWYPPLEAAPSLRPAKASRSLQKTSRILCSNVQPPKVPAHFKRSLSHTERCVRLKK